VAVVVVIGVVVVPNEEGRSKQRDHHPEYVHARVGSRFVHPT
jgi:hypothetical protein